MGENWGGFFICYLSSLVETKPLVLKPLVARNVYECRNSGGAAEISQVRTQILPENLPGHQPNRIIRRMATELKRSESMDRIAELLGQDASKLLDHTSQTILKDQLHLPGPDFVDRVWGISDRRAGVLRSLQTLFDNGRLAGTGYLSILPVDQGIEHSAGASFAPNPQYFDPENIIKLAIEGGCNAVASTFGVLGTVGRKYAHKIPFIVKINHNELLTLPNKFDQVLFGTG
jgi:class I fructose-bisphosphate aldolase